MTEPVPDPPVEPLSVRSGGRTLAPRRAGVPAYLERPLRMWLATFLTDRLERRVRLRMGDRLIPPGSMLRQALDAVDGVHSQSVHLVPWLGTGEDLLDAVDYALQLDDATTEQLHWSRTLPGDPEGGYPRLAEIGELVELLDDAGSAYTVAVAGDRVRLAHRVGPTVQASLDQAAAGADPTTAQLLRRAWIKAFARDPEPNEAYLDAVRAVEAVARALVCPNNTRASLNTVAQNLTDQAESWELVLTASSDDASVTPLIAMLKRLWLGNIFSRHGEVVAYRDVTLAEARAAVTLGVTCVHWLSTGVLRRKVTTP